MKANKQSELMANEIKYIILGVILGAMTTTSIVFGLMWPNLKQSQWANGYHQAVSNIRMIDEKQYEERLPTLDELLHAAREGKVTR